MDPGWRYGKQPPRLLTFKLGGTAELPPTPQPDFTVHPIDDPKLTIDEVAAARGQNLWNHTCLLCHGVAGVGAGSVAPDLRESVVAHDLNALRAILEDGLLVAGGMPKFDDRTEEEISDLLAYIRQISRQAATAQR